jgi:dihydroxyacetone kinase-like protein
MKRFVNRPEDMARESLEGFVALHEDLLCFGTDDKFVARRRLSAGKVALISGGGAGHEPLHTGFIGEGMLDAACTGHIFTSPTPDQIVAAINHVDCGAGCLLIVKNYDGDVMNFEMAAEMAARRHRIETVVVGDDVSGQSLRSSGRRGVAGTVILEKILGAAAENGMDLEALKLLGARIAPKIRSMGVAIDGAILPQTRRATFALGPYEMELGVGIHGEPGRSREPFGDARSIITALCDMVIAELPEADRHRALLFVNGFGATPPAELYLAYGFARAHLKSTGFGIVRSLAGTYVTSLDTDGLSVTVALMDDEMLRLWDQTVRTAILRW